MTEQAVESGKFRCGHCGWDSGATSRPEFFQLMQTHRGPACLALLNQLDGYQLVALAIDIQHLLGTSLPIGNLVEYLEAWGIDRKRQEARDAAQKAPNGTPQA